MVTPRLMPATIRPARAPTTAPNMARLDSRARTRVRSGRGTSKPKNRRGAGALCGGLGMQVQFALAAGLDAAGTVPRFVRLAERAASGESLLLAPRRLLRPGAAVVAASLGGGPVTRLGAVEDETGV